MKRKDLVEEVVLITGASGVLGRTYVRLLLEAGARVVATDYSYSIMQQRLGDFADNTRYSQLEMDVSSEESVAAAFCALIEANLRPTIVLNNAAMTGEFLMSSSRGFPSFSETTLEEWTSTLSVNLTGAFLVARELDRTIIKASPVRLINVGSMYGLRGPHHGIYEDEEFKSFVAYSASKAGIHGLTLWLAGYWAPYGCSVNTLAPGPVYNGHSKVFEDKVGALTMTGRMAKPDEIGLMMLSLCGAPHYFTGQLVNVDGGFSAW